MSSTPILHFIFAFACLSLLACTPRIELLTASNAVDHTAGAAAGAMHAWITAPAFADSSRANTWLVFRKDFTVNNLPESTIATIAADTKYWLWIN
ncbi:MAG: hypothetical protein AAGF89_13550, partial [Bacteroidota bacterium]